MFQFQFPVFFSLYLRAHKFYSDIPLPPPLPPPDRHVYGHNDAVCNILSIRSTLKRQPSSILTSNQCLNIICTFLGQRMTKNFHGTSDLIIRNLSTLVECPGAPFVVSTPMCPPEVVALCFNSTYAGVLHNHCDVMHGRTGMVFGIFASSIWYWCTDQVIVQRVLSARTEADGRIGCIIAVRNYDRCCCCCCCLLH